MERKNENVTHKKLAKMGLSRLLVRCQPRATETPSAVARIPRDARPEEHLSKSFVDDNMVVEKDIFFSTPCEQFMGAPFPFQMILCVAGWSAR